ncbi:hypothetical protein F2P81_001260 [Scophthalmus maximus]|uniref:Uncharacterized protein n=1 Tax=Scophthalmus maximus TaxID=52904 RepID=A0A6A4TL64_SCOMX|nr:hypothetical protein F2P81_001260 [Scophthalmus maximus]
MDDTDMIYRQAIVQNAGDDFDYTVALDVRVERRKQQQQTFVMDDPLLGFDATDAEEPERMNRAVLHVLCLCRLPEQSRRKESQSCFVPSGFLVRPFAPWESSRSDLGSAVFQEFFTVSGKETVNLLFVDERAGNKTAQ